MDEGARLSILFLFFFSNLQGCLFEVTFQPHQLMESTISQLIRYGRACSNYEDFIARGQLLTTRLQQQGYTTPRLKSTFRKFFGRQNDIVGIYEKSASDPAYWNKMAQEQLKKSLRRIPNTNRAKNVILFIGDGMGVSTVTAARIRRGQLQGKHGEETVLAFEEWPDIALTKTYVVDRQTADSAATATALLSGIKTNYYTVGLDNSAKMGDCPSSKGAQVTNIIKWSEEEGKSTGFVTNTRVTHATPSSVYAHSAHRDWEWDTAMRNIPGGCKDIAYQLVHNSNLEVAMGGGRYWFLPNDVRDPETNQIHRKQRKDQLNLIELWQEKQREHKRTFKYVWNRRQFDDIDPTKVDTVLGLFNPSHMQYELDRDKGPMGEPSLQEMTSKAIKILQKNDKGFFLMVEGGRIDHGHHDGFAKHALHETLALEDAVKEAMELTSEEDTLLILTADHSHVFNIAGYPKRGNPILGPTHPILREYYPADNKAYTTLQYSNGPGYEGCNRTDPNFIDIDKTYAYVSGIPLGMDTHGGEDVTVYARGPMSHLIHGVQEQNYIAHVMAYASCVGSNKQHCAFYKTRHTSGVNMIHSENSVLFHLFIAVLTFSLLF